MIAKYFEEPPVDDEIIQKVLDTYIKYYSVRHKSGYEIYSSLNFEFELDQASSYVLIQWLEDYGLIINTIRNYYMITELGAKGLSENLGWIETKRIIKDTLEKQERKAELLEAGQLGEARYYRFWWIPIAVSVISVLISILLPLWQSKSDAANEKTMSQKVDSLANVVNDQRLLLEQLTKPVRLDTTQPIRK